MIRAMVRECVHEMLAERFIEQTIHEVAGTKKQKPMRESVVERSEPTPTKRKKPLVEYDRTTLAKKFGFDENSPMASVYEDTMKNNPVINGDIPIDPPGTVSESALEKSGIMSKDWTKYF
jgi:hypothetical protein